MPASITGCSMPRTSVSLVFMPSPPEPVVGITVDSSATSGGRSCPPESGSEPPFA